MDDLLLALLICVTILVIAYMVMTVFREMYRAKAAKSRQMSAVRRGNTSKSQETPQMGTWVKDLLEQLGHDEDELYDDEMPDELADLLSNPVVKGILGGMSNKSAQPGQTQMDNSWH